MQNKLKDLIEINGIDKDALDESIYMDIRENILREICEYMKADGKNRVEIKSIYCRKSDNCEAARIVLQNVCNLKLPDDDIKWLNKCIIANFHKKPQRIQIAESVKSELLQKQGSKCAICGKYIDTNHMHVDHIVPWDYVGDELDDNYQALCPTCNEHKSNHVAEAVKNLIITKKEKGIKR